MKTVVFFIVSMMNCVLTFAQAQKSFEVIIKGKGEPVYLFPGFGCTGAMWLETVEELSKTHECHIFTFAGFGDVPPIESPWFTTIKEDVIKYTKTNKIKTPTLIGHSLGGTLSYWLAASEPNLFKKIIAIDALPSTAALMIPDYNGEKIPYNNPQSTMILEMDKNAFNNMNAQQVQFMCKNSEKHKFITEMINKADRKTYVYGYIDMLNLDLREEIANIKIPVIILAATFPDLETVKKTYTKQFEKLSSVSIHYAEGAAHFVMFDQPEWYIKSVKENL